MTAQDRVENYGRSRPPTGGAGYRPPHTGAGYRLERKTPPSPQLVGCGSMWWGVTTQTTPTLSAAPMRGGTYFPHAC